MKTNWCEWMRRLSLLLTVSLFVFFWFSTYPIAKSGLTFRDLSEAGVALWIFLIVGAVVILLQLIPAVIVITGFLAGSYKSNPIEKEITVKEVGKEVI